MVVPWLAAGRRSAMARPMPYETSDVGFLSHGGTQFMDGYFTENPSVDDFGHDFSDTSTFF